ncbi:MAG: hypothetical protein WKH47_06945 [Actinomycetes bacterium]
MSDVRTAPGRARIEAATLRNDQWWRSPLITFAVLFAFILYATWAAFVGDNYFSEPYVSPFYAPCLADICVEGTGQLAFIGEWWKLSPALLILPIPLGFRLTCYYYRKAYYRAFWLSPPACGVAEPHKSYTGETRFPLVLQNVHRYFFYLGLVLNGFLTYEAFLGFTDPEGGIGMGLGTVVLLVNAALLWLYSLSCHSCRNSVGGRINNFSKHPVRYWAWTQVSKMNAYHMQIAWVSLVWVALSDLYVRLLASGTITDLRFF